MKTPPLPIERQPPTDRRTRVLITGANGFLAQAVARQCPCGWDLVGLIRQDSPTPNQAEGKAYRSLAELFVARPSLDLVLHLAARIPVPIDAEPPDMHQVNVDLVSQLVIAYPDARHVLASSASVYGRPEKLPITTGTRPNPVNSYGGSKLAAELLVRRLRQHAIIRFSSLIGPGMRLSSFVPAAVKASRSGTIPVFGDGRRRQNYLDVEDAAAMVLRAAQDDDSYLALGVGDRSYSNQELAEILAALTGAAIVHQGEDNSPSFDYAMAGRVDIGRPGISLECSLRRMIAA